MWLLLRHILLLIQAIDDDFDLCRFRMQITHRRRETVARFSFPFVALEGKGPGFAESKMDDLIAPSTPLPAEPEEKPGNLLTPQYAVQPPENQME